MSRFDRVGVRARTTLIATAVVGLVLAGSSVLLVGATTAALDQSIETSVTSRAVDVASQLELGSVPGAIASIRGISVQIVKDGEVVLSTRDIEGQGPLAVIDQQSTGVTSIQIPTLDDNEGEGDFQGEGGDGGPYLAVRVPVTIGGDRFTVIAAESVAPARNTRRTLIPLLFLGVPAVTLLAGMTVWRLTKRAFRPVDAMAQLADSISIEDLHKRIPEPVSNDEVKRLSVVLNGMLERLETAVTRQRQFTADASHELKSPVATLLTMAEVAEANPSRFGVGELAADVAEQSRRLAALIDDLLILARSDEHRLDLEFTDFDLGELVREQLSRNATSSVAVTTAASGPVAVRADRRRFEQIIRNLLDNATRHATASVSVTTSLSNGRATVIVRDDGEGVPKPDREKIFERFVRLDEARSRSDGGTGLGLSVVRQLVEAHGGSIVIDGDPDLGGARVTVDIPDRPALRE